MNTKVSFFVLTLTLATIACSTPSQLLSISDGSAPESVVPNSTSTSTSTAVPSATHTNTPVPSTETRTPRPPTDTPTPLPPQVEVIGEGPLNVRIGPCNQQVLTQATPGMKFKVTGRFTSAAGEEWWRIQYRTRSGARLVEGWIWGVRVEATGVTDVPFVPSQCPPFPTGTPDKPEQNIGPTSVNPPTGLPACQTQTLEFHNEPDIDFRFKLDARLLQGDREFGGNGPEVQVRVMLKHDGHTARVRIGMVAKETAYDWTTGGHDTGWIRLFTVPSGWRIRTMNLGKVDAATGFDFGDWLFSYTDDDYDPDVFEPQDGGPLRRIEVMGETGPGVDITWGLSGGLIARGTGADIWFHSPMKVEVVEEGNCQ